MRGYDQVHKIISNSNLFFITVNGLLITDFMVLPNDIMNKHNGLNLGYWNKLVKQSRLAAQALSVHILETKYMSCFEAKYI